MSDHRLAYDDAATTEEMASDARVAGVALRLPAQAAVRQRVDGDAPAAGAPVVTDDLARMAAGLQLHLD